MGAENSRIPSLDSDANAADTDYFTKTQTECPICISTACPRCSREGALPQLSPSQLENEGALQNNNHPLVQIPPCFHVFHYRCLEAWLKALGDRTYTCPMCRQVLELGREDIASIKESEEISNSSVFMLGFTFGFICTSRLCNFLQMDGTSLIVFGFIFCWVLFAMGVCFP